MTDGLMLEAHAVDAIVKKVIAEIVAKLVQESIERLVGAESHGGYHHGALADEVRKFFMKEIEAMVVNDPDVKAALKGRLVRELNKKERW